MKRTLIVILAAVLGSSILAFAQQPNDPATQEDVKKLFGLMQSREQFQKLLASMTQQYSEMFQGVFDKYQPNATPQQREQQKKFIADSMTQMLNNMPYDELMRAAQPAYQHHLTHGEAEELIAFYSSPTGQKLIAELPAIMGEYMQNASPIMQKWVTANVEQLKKDAEELARKMAEQEKTKDKS